jgi:hypothetical protein
MNIEYTGFAPCANYAALSGLLSYFSCEPGAKQPLFEPRSGDIMVAKRDKIYRNRVAVALYYHGALKMSPLRGLSGCLYRMQP